MTDLHALAHDAVATWAPFAAAAAALGAALLAVALLAARRAGHRLSARSGYMLLSIALIAPAAGAFVLPTQVAGWVSAFASLGGPAPSVIEGSVDTTLRFQALDASEDRLDALCFLGALWVAGFIVVLFGRSVEWSMWRRIARRSDPFDDARVEAIVRAVWGDRGGPPPLRASRDCDEPMVVGLVRPVVLLPRGYGAAMDDAEIEAVAVHELEHVRRRDNLDAALIDLFASLFWFDPLRWIARRRLLALREGACDERVLERGLPPRAYLAALAKTSHAAIESPAVACMSGFRIRERMDSIMTYATRSSKWIPESLVRAASLAVLALVALAIAGFAPASAGATPGEDTLTNVSMADHRLTLRMNPDPEGRIVIDAEIRKPDGTLVSAPRLTALPGQSAEITTTVDARTYRLLITPAADGSGLAKLEVLEGGKVIDTVVRSIPPPPAGYERVGEDVTAPVVATRVNPTYPEEARKARVTGLVILEAMIDEKGVVRDVRALEPLPNGLTEAAVDAVRQWTFKPALKNGKPVPVIFNLTINFKLDGKKPEEKQ